MNNNPTISIIIATLNSAHTLPKVLNSIRNQTYPSSRVEILVIDGGSTDNTKKLALSYNCRFVKNPKILPKWAKFIGYTKANGKYAMFLDSDEVIESTHSLQRRINVFSKYKSVRGISGSGYKSPKGHVFINQYINEFGDPFSFFYYGLSKDYRFYIKLMKERYHVSRENSDHVTFDFSTSRNVPLLELAAMGGMIDLQFFKAQAPEIINNPPLIAHFINLLVSRKGHFAIIKNDPLIHYSSDTLNKYKGKIVSRVVNNIFTPAKEGFKGRDEYSDWKLRIKKYLFLPYALTIIGPVIDSLILSVTRRHMGYFIHVPLSFYTAYLIVYYSILKLTKTPVVLKSYGESQPVKTL